MAARKGSWRIGVDLGGTKLAVGVVDDGGNIVGRCVTYDHKGLDEESVLGLVERDTAEALSRAGLALSDARGVGILFPGHIRWPEGITLTTSNLPGFKNYPLRARVEERLGIPCLADNDANAQALGEYRFGAGRGVDPMVFMTVSSGIGGGIVIGGRLYRGFTGTAGEFGHMIIDASSGRSCACGNRGYLMGQVSGIAIPEAARSAALRLAASGGNKELPGSCLDFDGLDGAILASGCADGNDLCRAVVEEFARCIGIGMYNIFQVLNPGVIVLGGGLLQLPEFFFENAAAACYELAGSMMYDKMEIRRGSLGAWAGVLGAVALFAED